MTTTWILRDLPGVAEFESRYQATLKHRSPMWHPDREQLKWDLYAHIERLFGFQVERDGLEGYDLDEVDGVVLGEIELDIVSEFGWDISDGQGRPLGIARHFLWPIAAVAHGRLPPLDLSSVSSLPKVAPEDWGSALEAEARKFRPNKDRR